MDNRKRSTLPLKAISLFLGILLWLFVTNENIIITRHTLSGVEVTARNLGAGLKAVYNDTVDLEVSAKTVDRSAYHAYVDLSGMGPGKHQVPVRVKTPAGVKLTKVAPARITVTITEVNEKVVPVEVRLDQEPPAGFRVTGLVPTPAQVLVRGSYTELLQVSEVQAKIDLSTTRTATVIPLKMTAVNQNGKEVPAVKVIPDEGEVYVVVEADKKETSLPVKVEVSGYLPEGYNVASITTEPAEVRVYGSQDILERLQEVVTEPVNIDNATESMIKETKLVSIPGVVMNPSSILVKVEIKSRSANP